LGTSVKVDDRLRVSSAANYALNQRVNSVKNRESVISVYSIVDEDERLSYISMPNMSVISLRQQSVLRISVLQNTNTDAKKSKCYGHRYF